MENIEFKSAAIALSQNNKELLVKMLGVISDEMPFSENETMFLAHHGVLGQYLEYKKALTLLKKLGAIDNFRNTRYKKPIAHNTVYVDDAFEITYKEDVLLDFNRALSSATPSVPSNNPTTGSAHLPVNRTKVELRSYDIANGILTICGKQVEIIKQQNKKGKLYESKQARLMRLLFNDVNGDFGATPMRTVVSVRAADFRPKHRKLVKSYASEINGKLEREVSVKDFLLCNQQAVMINELYLK